ncbi:cysteine desulfurase family protein [Ruicaihuangia caeni]|uniref:cysteine desulfurase family protein n=1 Tax=Ruicaihuangia caeni TaxID=3042517 RepID=UPI00338EF8B4
MSALRDAETRPLYLDAAATAPPRREVVEAMWPYLTSVFGNPASRHGVGERARRALDAALEELAALLGCRPSELIVTSGGTEADNLAIKGIALAAPRGRRIVTTAIEHPAVLESARYLQRLHGFDLALLEVDEHALVDAERLREVATRGTTLVSVMLANNEVGTVQPLAELAEITRSLGVPLHTDAVQAAGMLPLHMPELGVDALSIAGHKLGTPRGAGLLFVRRGIRLEPLMHGGGQQRDRRSGTEDVAAAVGLAMALRLATAERVEHAERLAGARDRFIRTVLDTVPGARLTGHPSQRLPNNASFCFEGTAGEAVLLELERRAVICSSGSACAAGSTEPSSVLTAMGIPAEIAHTAVRFTFSAETTERELDRAAALLHQAVASVQEIGVHVARAQ